MISGAGQDRLADSLAQIYERIGPEQRLMLEYKFFEPAFYHTDVPDWGTSYAQVAALGDRAAVCLDTGHHAPGTNIEFIVAQLLRLGKLGSLTSTLATTPTTISSSDPPIRSSCSGSCTRSYAAAGTVRTPRSPSC